MKKSLVVGGLIALSLFGIGSAFAEGRNDIRTHHSCSSNIKKPTIVKFAVFMSPMIASVNFRNYYKGSSPKVSVYEWRGVKGYRARAVIKNKRSGIAELHTCYFAAKSGRVVGK